jgi:hypothetical protein
MCRCGNNKFAAANAILFANERDLKLSVFGWLRDRKILFKWMETKPNKNRETFKLMNAFPALRWALFI